MSNLVIQPVTRRRDRKAFLQLPWKIYRGDPNWIPPILSHQAELVGFRHHPFYQHNQVQTFLAYRDGEACGRIAAIINREHIRRYNEPRGFFGFFESIDDQEVASALFDAARSWLQEHNLPWIRGPVNPSLNYECGMLIDGFDTPPTFMMTYNPPYYQQLTEAYGFQKSQNLYAFDGHVDMLKTLDKKLDFVVAEATRRFDITLRPLDRKRFAEDVRTFLDIYNQSLGGTWGFTPLSKEEMEAMAAGLRWLIVPELTSIAEIGGRPIGAVFALLDYNPRIRQINGRLFPFGFLRLLWNRKAIRRIRLISTNVLPEFQRWGVGLVATARLVPVALDWGIQEAEFSWVLESNHLSYKTLKKGGVALTKTYRIYDYDPQ
jgi:GNAT superfamily N-acetyltransferase